ncbi:MAG: RagB/SusD family nutrient uptake outer membrane protein, partial [Duncaniella sp.]|nr:RagB/SusD family nutrient uptake outer membrane protein [Duncaniella sp.]
MKLKKYMVWGVLSLATVLTSCVDDLNVDPENPNIKTTLNSRDEYLGVIARAYGGLVLEGGVQVNDGGRAVYTRLLWNLQELGADEAIVGDNWKDAGLPEVKANIAGPDCAMLYEAYSRFNYQIALCNETLRVLKNSGDAFTPAEVDAFSREMRVLRALSYYHIIDIFGKGPWTDENSEVGEIPPTYTRAQLFSAVVADLQDAVPGMIPAAQQVYGRVSREAGYMLLAKLYLNAEVYTGTPMWNECAQACQQVTATLNTLAPEYKYLFWATTDKYVGNGEIIWGVPQDANTLQTYGGTTYLAIGCYNADVYAAQKKAGEYPYGLEKDPWGGPRVQPELSQALASNDKRRLIYEGELHESVANLQDWKIDGDGYMCIKYVYTPE